MESFQSHFATLNLEQSTFCNEYDFVTLLCSGTIANNVVSNEKNIEDNSDNNNLRKNIVYALYDMVSKSSEGERASRIWKAL